MATWQSRIAMQSMLALSMRRARRHEPNPFDALEVQLSLTRVEAWIATLLADRSRFARGHHLRAARLARANLLEEACRLAGIDDLPEGDSGLRRMMAEAELRNRGWTW